MDDLAALEKQLRAGDVAAFIVEPIQGKGVYIPAGQYLPEAQRLCRKYGTLFIADEVQVGMGRTGRFLCCEHWGLEPDIVTLSKSLGGGYIPVSATITRRKIHDATFNRLDRCQTHSTTFGQNELAMAAGLASLHVLDEERLVERAATMGEKLLQGLSALRERYEMIADVRGKGLMIGIEFKPPAVAYAARRLDRCRSRPKGPVRPVRGDGSDARPPYPDPGGRPDVNIIKFLPPLIIGEEEVTTIVSAMDQVMAEADGSSRARVGAKCGTGQSFSRQVKGHRIIGRSIPEPV